MAKTRYFYDSEEQTVYTLDELQKLFDEFKANGDTDEECFSYWLGNATDKNGTLTEITYRTLERYVNTRKSTLPIVAYDWNTSKMLDCICLEDFSDYIVADVTPWGLVTDIYGESVSEAVFVIRNANE